MNLRAKQAAKKIQPNNGKWRDRKTKEQEERTIAKTAKIANKFGYTREKILSHLTQE